MDAPVELTLTIVRPDDLLVLSVQAVNLRLDTSQPNRARLVPDTPGEAAYLVYVFPPQSVAEQAFFETASVPAAWVQPAALDATAAETAEPPGRGDPAGAGQRGFADGRPEPAGLPAAVLADRGRVLDRGPARLVAAGARAARRRGRPARGVQRAVGTTRDRGAGQPGNLPGAALPADDVAERDAGRGAARLGARGGARAARGARRAVAHAARPTAPDGRPDPLHRGQRGLAGRRCAPSGRRTSWRTARCPRRALPSGPPWWRATATRS